MKKIQTINSCKKENFLYIVNKIYEHFKTNKKDMIEKIKEDILKKVEMIKKMYMNNQEQFDRYGFKQELSYEIKMLNFNILIEKIKINYKSYEEKQILKIQLKRITKNIKKLFKKFKII